MRRTSVRVIAVVAAVLSMLTLGLSLTSAGAGVRRAQPAAPSHRRPVIFVHGFTGSGAQFETQALRFTSNGYAPKLIAVHEYDSLFGVETRDQVFARLDQRIADLLRASHADQVDLLGHSLGTTLMQAYLNSTPARAAKVAHYVNLDGATATSPPGGVPTLAIWGMGSTTRKIVGAANLYFTNQTHVQVVTSPETFKQIYTFFTGKEPETTNVLPEGRNINLAGRAQIFPQNTGFDGTLKIFEINGATGRRLDNIPDATFALHGDGAWGPFHAHRGDNYEFAIVRPGTQTHHLYFEPFVRSDYWVRLLTSPKSGGIGDLIEKSDRHAALTIVRYKEIWGDQGVNNDEIEINGVNVVNAANSPITKRVNAIFAFDAGSDGVTDLATPIPSVSALPFLTGVDIFVPGARPAHDTISVAITPRLGGGRTELINVPNWVSSKDAISVQFHEYIQN